MLDAEGGRSVPYLYRLDADLLCYVGGIPFHSLIGGTFEKKFMCLSRRFFLRLPMIYVNRICSNCGVSADWLLDMTERKTLNPNPRTAETYTGLSGESIRILHH